MSQQIAKTIAAQMGGMNRLIAMTGAKNFGTNGNDLSFKFFGCKKYSHVKIELNTMDLYDVTFYKCGKYEIKNKKEINGVYCDMLVDIFESETGLNLSL